MIRPRARWLAAVVAVALFALWVFRSRVEHALASPEPDYTPDAEVGLAYPRPRADLTPIWRAELHAGYGGAAIDGGEVFVLDREPGVADTLRVFDLATGAERWDHRYPSPGRLDFAGSRTTPVVVGEHVYVCGSFGQVVCLDRQRREPVWSVDLERDCGGQLPYFGWAASPLVYEGLVIVPALGPDVGLIALDRLTGEPVWRTPGLGHSHSTPVLLELLGELQVVFLSSEAGDFGAEGPQPAIVSSFEPASGRPLWRVETMLTNVPIPPPVRVDGERLFLTGGYGAGSVLLRASRSGGEYSFDEEYRIDKGAQLHPPVVHDGHVYLLANENSNESRRRRHLGGLMCIDPMGRELWRTGDDPYFGRGHLIQLGDYLLVQDGLSGMLRMCAASPAGYVQVATANVFESPPKARERTWAKMARAGGTLIVRGREELRCVRLGDRAVAMR